MPQLLFDLYDTDAAEPIFAAEIAQFAAAPRVRGLEWAIDHVKNEDGKPYNHSLYPHLGAPGGPWDAWDDEDTRQINLQFATRLGKTFFGQCCHEHTAAVQPSPMMFASSVEKLARDVISRLYRMLEHCQPLSHQLLRPDLRSKELVDLRHCPIYVGWSLSPSTLGDKNVKIGHGNEINKWEREKTSTEGDPLDLFLDRGKDFPTRKFILESTPSIKGASRIERQMSTGIRSALFVPCPFCEGYQELRLAQIVWDKPPGSKASDVNLARRTARYQCEHCNTPIFDHHRRTMLRLGVWVPAGCSIDNRKALDVSRERLERLRTGRFSITRPGRYWKQDYLTGTPTNDGPSAGFQLASWYATKLTWGDVAAAWIAAQGETASLQTFINQWAGELWATKRRVEEWESLAMRLTTSVPEKVVPMWGTTLVAAIDRQQDHYKYLVDAYGPGGQNHTITYGRWDATLDELYQQLILAKYPHADGGPPLAVSGTAIDHGFKPDDPESLSMRALSAKPQVVVLCVKGASTSLEGPYRQTQMQKHPLYPGLPLILIDGNWTQEEIEKRLHRRKPGTEGSMSVYSAPAADHEAFCREILNEEPLVKGVSAGGRRTSKVNWDRIDHEYPNDYRDLKHYAWVMFLIRTRGKPKPRVKPEDDNTRPAPAESRLGAIEPLRTVDGRPFLITERMP